MNTDKQRIRVQRYLSEGNTLTSRESSRKLNIDRLAARICELRKERKGNQFLWSISDEWEKHGRSRVKRYRMDMPKARRRS